MASQHDPPAVADAPEAGAEAQLHKVLQPDWSMGEEGDHEPVPNHGGSPVPTEAPFPKGRADQAKACLDQTLARDDAVKARLRVSIELTVAGDLPQPTPVLLGREERSHA